MDLGAVRRDAYRGMADRVGIPQMRGLVGALIQAEELGSPINDALTRQAEILRSGRRQAVRDAAARTAPKVQLVVAMVMVPGALLVVVGVMVLQLVGQLGAVTGGMP
jgi:tight adherence protein C